jgi:hypothetical protein
MSVFRLKPDGTEAVTPLDDLRAEAFVYGWVLKLEMQLDGTSVSIPAPGGLKPLDDASPPAQAQEILYELLTKHHLKMIEALNCERRARGQKPIGDAAFLEKWKANFEKAYYGTLRESEQGRRVVDLLKAWRGSLIAEQRGWLLREDSARIALLEPFLQAVSTLDVEFFELLKRAALMLDTRVRSSKATFGAGDFDLNIWLLQYGITIAGTPTHTARELNEQFVLKFRSISDAKLREKCRKLGIPLKEDVRGAGSVRRKTGSNSTARTSKRN